MAYDYLSGILEIANVFISLFVLIYAWSFLRQTADVKDRKPWVFLFVAAIVFFLFEVVGVLDVFNISKVPGLRSFLESAFIALILFVFIFQYDLILKSDLILITRKIAREEKLEKDEQEISKHLGMSPATAVRQSLEPEENRAVSESLQKQGKKRATKKGKRPAKKRSPKKRQ
ncbi:hypothetical protein GF367_03705 [Candidatus Woesearchaeota archaeon]|nr:hypothetical protein [Candidatus Woesearchaeota archaeon]